MEGSMTVGELTTFLFYSLYVGVAFTGEQKCTTETKKRRNGEREGEKGKEKRRNSRKREKEKRPKGFFCFGNFGFFFSLFSVTFHFFFSKIYFWKGISSFWSQFNKAIGSSQRVFQLLDYYSEEEEDPNRPPGVVLQNLQGKIRFRNVRERIQRIEERRTAKRRMGRMKSGEEKGMKREEKDRKERKGKKGKVNER